MKVLLQATKSAPNPPFMNAIVKLMAPCLQKNKIRKTMLILIEQSIGLTKGMQNRFAILSKKLTFN